MTIIRRYLHSYDTAHIHSELLTINFYVAYALLNAGAL